IISSTEGAVSLTGDTLNRAATDGSPAFKQFQVVFDRPIDPGSFTKDAVKVFFRSPSTTGAQPGTPVTVDSVTAVDSGPFGSAGIDGATTFLVKLLNPQTAVGTYSYFITPDMHD